MLLKQIKLNNFRQFIGEQPAIEFSTDLEKNVTIIMGDNDSGKTTLAQAFTWCLYGETDFEDKYMINTSVAINMMPNTTETVKVELELKHNGLDYNITREQRYMKDNNGTIKKPGQTIFKISYKNSDGQTEFVSTIDTDVRMKEILPKELSKYFFFDGERIGNISKEIRKGKSSEFAMAVRSLLGLSAFTSALDHLKAKTSKVSVIKSYEESYDSKSNSKIAGLTENINNYVKDIEDIENRLIDIDQEENIANDKCNDLREKIDENKNSEELNKEKNELINKKNVIISKNKNHKALIIKEFNKVGQSYFSIKLINDALKQLTESEKIDKGIPDIHLRTIEYLVKRGKCICGAEIEEGNSCHKELMKVKEYIPPQSIGTLISQFIRECELKTQLGEDLFDKISLDFSGVRESDNDIDIITQEILDIETKLEGMIDIGDLQRKLKTYERNLEDLKDERDQKNREKGSKETLRDRLITERHNLSLKDENNRKIETYKAYAQHMYDVLKAEYDEQERRTRIKLGYTVNDIFTSIFDGEFSLLIDEKYNVKIIVEVDGEIVEDVEAGTAKSTSVIFAFIAGVIKMARQSNGPDNELMVSEPYPLVMDAPLSAFDKTRIKTVCDTIPSVAEQVIIFIKDTDGEIAEKYMGNRVGARYIFDKVTPFETKFAGGKLNV